MLTKTTLEHEYQQCKRWQNEISFYQTEVHILHLLLDKHISSLIDRSQTARVNELLSELFCWSQLKNPVSFTLDKCLEELSVAITQPNIAAFTNSINFVEALQPKMEDLRDEYLQLKAVIYDLIAKAHQTNEQSK